MLDVRQDARSDPRLLLDDSQKLRVERRYSGFVGLAPQPARYQQQHWPQGFSKSGQFLMSIIDSGRVRQA